jgi:hypothetical protein
VTREVQKWLQPHAREFQLLFQEKGRFQKAEAASSKHPQGSVPSGMFLRLPKKQGWRLAASSSAALLEYKPVAAIL